MIYVIEKNSPDATINDDDYKDYLEAHVDFIIENYLNDSLEFGKYNTELWNIGKQYREIYLLFNPPRVVAKNIEAVPALVRVPVMPAKRDGIKKENEE